MPTRKKKNIPTLRRHHRGSHFVVLNREPIWLGTDPEEAREAYDRTIAEWLANGRQLVAADDEDEPLTITSLCVEYTKHLEQRYAKNYAATLKTMIKILRALYGSTEADKFGPKKLRIVRNEMVSRGWSRRFINAQVSRMRSLFKWGAAHELCSERVYRRLATVEPLRAGEAKKEGKAVKPVPRSDVRRVRRHLTRPVRALIDLQLLTGARACELVGLRAIDFDRSNQRVWKVELGKHKTAHHGKTRTLYFGPRARRILGMFMTTERPLDKPLFSPREANAEGKRRNANGQRRPNQKPTPTKGSRAWRNQYGQGKIGDVRAIGDRYDTDAYRKAIHRACEAAGISNWGPHRLRHNAATFLRRQYGIDMAAVILGHSSLVVTLTYAEANEKKAMQVMADVG